MLKKFLTIHDIPREQAGSVVARAIEMKRTKHRSGLLEGKTLALIFEKASTRTRVSFEMAIRHLGGSTIYMTQNDSQLGRSEPVEDTIRVLSRYVDGLVMRTFEHSKLTRMWAKSSIPIVNALSDDYHPCQVLGDMMTMAERGADFPPPRWPGLATAITWLIPSSTRQCTFLSSWPLPARKAICLTPKSLPTPRPREPGSP